MQYGDYTGPFLVNHWRQAVELTREHELIFSAPDLAICLLHRFEDFLRSIELVELDLQALRGKARRADPADPPFWAAEQPVKLEFVTFEQTLPPRRLLLPPLKRNVSVAPNPDNVLLEEGGGGRASGTAQAAANNSADGNTMTAGQNNGSCRSRACMLHKYMVYMFFWPFMLLYFVLSPFLRPLMVYLLENWTDNMYACVMATMVRNAPKQAHCFYPFAGDSYCMKVICNILVWGTGIMLGFLAYAFVIVLKLDAIRGAEPDA